MKTQCGNMNISSKELNRKRGENMSYDYAKLATKITQVCGTQAVFAEKMGLSERSVSLKLNNKRPWKQPEMHKSAEVLGFEHSEIQEYFFTAKVQ